MIFHSTSKRPVLIVGNGARLADAGDLIYELIEKTHIPALPSMNTVDMVQDKYRIGFIGTYGNRIANMILTKATLCFRSAHGLACGRLGI